jgi:hypothetical protein
MDRAALIRGLRIKLRDALGETEALVGDDEHLAVAVLVDADGHKDADVAHLAPHERLSQMPSRKT